MAGGRAGLLLAAGASRRFGPQDKLLAMLDGQPLIAHAARALRDTPLDDRIAVIANPALIPHLDGFRIVFRPQDAPDTQSASLRAGVLAAGRPDRLLIALGDMPRITPAHFGAVLSRTTDRLPAASHDGRRPMPPACFPAAALTALCAIDGDRGAGAVLQDLPASQLILAEGMLADIDLPADLAASSGPSSLRKYPTGGSGGT